MPTFQLFNQYPTIDRTKHVWKQNGQNGERLIQEESGKAATLYKCLLCGALTTSPDDDSLPKVYEKLTDAERKLVQPRFKLDPAKGNK